MIKSTRITDTFTVMSNTKTIRGCVGRHLFFKFWYTNISNLFVRSKHYFIFIFDLKLLVVSESSSYSTNISNFSVRSKHYFSFFEPQPLVVSCSSSYITNIRHRRERSKHYFERMKFLFRLNPNKVGCISCWYVKTYIRP